MKKSFLQNWLVLLCFVTTCLLLSKVNAQSQWSSTSSGLWTGNRVSLDGGGQIPDDQRMSITTTNDRFGLYIKNSTDASSVTTPVPWWLCLPEGESGVGTIYGIYASVPYPFGGGQYAGYFDGGVGICGGLEINNGVTPARWFVSSFDGDSDHLKFWESGVSALSATFNLSSAPSTESAYAYITVEDGNNRAFEVKEGNPMGPSGAPQFYVQGNGEAVSHHSMTVYNGQNNHPIKMISSASGTEKFYVRDDGAVHSKAGVTVVTENAANIWQPLLVQDGASGEDLFYVANNGQISTKGGLRVLDANDDVQFKISDEGYMTAREVKVTLKPIPDYVFEPDYDLLTLDELETYIAKNKHLPNIPSAKEIEKNGIGLGDLQVRELEKIEELTLYILQLNKRLEALEKENEELKKLITK